MKHNMGSKIIKILVIDHDSGNQIIIKAFIKEAFPEILTLSAVSGLKGLHLASSENPDVIMLDIVMPDMNSIEVCQKLKADRVLRNIPIVFFTSPNVDKETRLRALEAGAESFLSKPIDEIEFTALVRTMLKLKNTSSEKRNENKQLSSLIEKQIVEIKQTQIATLNMLEDVTSENEARKKSEEALFKSEEKYRTIFENVQDVFYQTNLEGIIIDISPSIFHLSKYTREELVGGFVYVLYSNPYDRQILIDTILKNGQIIDYELKFKTKSGDVNYVSINARLVFDANGKPNHIDGAIRDIQDRKLAENRINLSSQILNSLNTTTPLADTIKLTLNLIQYETGCDAIGIRLKNGDDYPYFIQNGFSDAFLQTENSVVVRDREGVVCKNEDGTVCLEGKCGLVLSGQTDSTNPLFTEGGSFWTNNSPALLNLTEAEDLRINPRNRCIWEGFLSFALIPVRAKGEIVGLMQLNHRKRDCFTLEMIHFFESIGEIIGVALMRKQAEEALEKSHKLLFNLSEQVSGVIYQYVLYSNGRSCFPYSSSGMNDIYEVSPDEVRLDASLAFDRIHPDDRERVSSLIFESARTLNHFFCEYRVLLPKKGLRWRYSDAVPERMEGNSTLWHGIIYDITERKQNEEKLRHVARLYAVLSQINQAIVMTRDQDELFRTICRVAIETGQFRMAWIGLFDEADGRIKPVTHAGFEDGYLDQVFITTGDLPSGKGPTGTAFKHGHVTICYDIATEPQMILWKDKALERGYRSSAAVPFMRKGVRIGILTLYASETDFFTDDEQKLLQEIGEGISFALDAMDSEAKRKETELKLLGLNIELENRVKQRTKELEASNAELETFSYSVSHDLKAPLRHINGFIGLFIENKSTSFNEEELGYLKKITDAATEMALLIDALLSFSRLNMTELKKTNINSSAMVQQVIKFFEPDLQNRKITFNVAPLPEIQGDQGLIRQVWTNFLANAIKYTGKKPEAVIDIGFTETSTETTFFIKDNGAGFNMKYAEKLFGVFQRLHKSRDFEGIGIGLANVSRIVKRHGGQCRAEGEADQGATFYFSVPNTHHQLAPSPFEKG